MNLIMLSKNIRWFWNIRQSSSDRLAVQSLPSRIEQSQQVSRNFAQMSQVIDPAQLRTDRSGALCFNQTTGQPMRDANNNLVLNQIGSKTQHFRSFYKCYAYFQKLEHKLRLEIFFWDVFESCIQFPMYRNAICIKTLQPDAPVLRDV